MNSKTIDLNITIDENRKVEIKVLTGEKCPNNDWRLFFFISYLSKNLEFAIADLISQMIEDEQKIILEGSLSYGSAERREKMIRDLTSKFEKNVRKRLAKNKDYLEPEESKGKKKIDFQKEQILFANKFTEICGELQRENKKLNRINIAQKMFGRNSNNHQKLKRILNDLNWKFQDVLNAYLKK